MKAKLIGFIGAPGTGKTTLSCAMKEYLMVRGVSTDVCTEYAREYCFRFGIPKHPYAQYRITFEQIRREDLLSQGNNKYVFSDSPAWLGYIYSLANIPGINDHEINTSISDMYEKFVINQIHRYEIVFYIRNEKPYNDGCRDEELTNRINATLDGFVRSHKHFLPIVEMDIPIEQTEKRKEFVWNKLNAK